MSKVFELNYAGVGELLKSSEMIDVLTSYADQVASHAGDGYSTYVGATRANVSVRAETKEAEKDNYNNNTLLKATSKAGLSLRK